MTTNTDLARFVEAQRGDYERALREIKNGRKTGHWMWYIFPQIRGLGLSETSRFYGIINRAEAISYLNHELLGSRLIEVSTALLNLQTNNAVQIFGSIDSLKLKSSMTLFALLDQTDPVFQNVLNKFYKGEKDEQTIQLLNETS